MGFSVGYCSKLMGLHVAAAWPIANWPRRTGTSYPGAQLNLPSNVRAPEPRGRRRQPDGVGHVHAGWGQWQLASTGRPTYVTVCQPTWWW